MIYGMYTLEGNICIGKHVYYQYRDLTWSDIGKFYGDKIFLDFDVTVSNIK